MVTVVQQGANVVVTGSGAIDLSGLSLNVPNVGGLVAIAPGSAFILFGQGQLDLYTGVSGPSSFGQGGGTSASSASGSAVGIEGAEGFLFVPAGYTSSTPLGVSTSTYDGLTLSFLGVTPGIYKWSWGTGVNQNFTLQIGATAAPDGGSTIALLLLGAAFCLAGRKSRFANCCGAKHAGEISDPRL